MRTKTTLEFFLLLLQLALGPQQLLLQPLVLHVARLLFFAQMLHLPLQLVALLAALRAKLFLQLAALALLLGCVWASGRGKERGG